MIEQKVIVSPRLRVVPQLEVAEGQVVEALAAAFWGSSEDLGQEPDSFLLFGTSA